MRRREAYWVRRLCRDLDADTQESKEMKYFEVALDVSAVTVDSENLMRRHRSEALLRRHCGETDGGA